MKMSSLNCSVKMSPHGDMGDTHDEQEGSPARGSDQGCGGRPHQHWPGGDGDRPERPAVSASESPVPGGGRPGLGAQSPGGSLRHTVCLPTSKCALVRTITLLPWIISGVVVALIWEFIYQPNYGLLNDILSRAGWMTERVAWLSSPALAMPAVVFTNIWRGVPFFAIMLLAGLQAIPTELYEAARVDGASVGQRFRHITLPMLKPIIVVATATRIVWTFNYADLIFVMTSGGPANATQITSTYTLLQAYSNLDFGYAATLSIVLLVIMLAFTIVYLRVTRGVESTG